MKRLRKIGYKKSGYYLRLEEELDRLGYIYPYQKVLNGETYFGYCIDGVQAYWMNYADACAEKIIYIHEENKLRK